MSAYRVKVVVPTSVPPYLFSNVRSRKRDKMNGILQLIGIYAVVLLVPVTGMTFTVIPDTVIVGGSTGDQISMRCAFSDGLVVTSLNLMQIQRSTVNGWETLGILIPATSDTASLTDPLPTDLQNKGLSVSETFDNGNPSGSILILTLARNAIQCSDGREYRCSISYLTYNAPNVDSPTESLTGNLTVSELPVVTSLVGKKNGYAIEGSSSFQAAFNAGDELELTCMANIGSISSTTIEWKQSSETSIDFIEYNPPSGTFDSGTAINNGQCGYTRTASIKYNTTDTDAIRPLNLVFECYVIINASPYNGYTTVNNPLFYADVTGTPTSAPGAATAGSGDVGVIAGGIVGGLVLIVLVVLLVYFLWYRRRSSGQDYKTKEEYGDGNPKFAPDTYAVPDKTRNRNKTNQGNGSEAPSKPKPRARHQELHYAELDLTKHPPVAPRKKINEPVEYAEVRFHN